jgi:hypothetical protein
MQRQFYYAEKENWIEETVETKFSIVNRGQPLVNILDRLSEWDFMMFHSFNIIIQNTNENSELQIFFSLELYVPRIL